MDLSDDEVNEYVQQGGKLTVINNRVYVMLNENDPQSGADENPKESSIIYEKIHDLYDFLKDEINEASLPIMENSSLFKFEEFLKIHKANLRF